MKVKIKVSGFPFQKKASLNNLKEKTLKQQFSLTEILVVIIIMGILMAISLPAFTSIMKGIGVEAAGRNICQTLKMARTHAVNNNRYVAVLMPSKLGTSGRPSLFTSNIDPLYLNTSYRFCYVNNKGGTLYFDRWIPGENWEFLPEGTIFLELNDSPGVSLTANMIKPTEGTITKVLKVNYADIDGNKIEGTTNDEATAAIVFKPNGKIFDGKRFVLIGEGGYQNGNQIVTKRDPEAYVSIKVDQFTGRISYGKEE